MSKNEGTTTETAPQGQPRNPISRDYWEGCTPIRGHSACQRCLRFCTKDRDGRCPWKQAIAFMATGTDAATVQWGRERFRLGEGLPAGRLAALASCAFSMFVDELDQHHRESLGAEVISLDAYRARRMKAADR